METNNLHEKLDKTVNEYKNIMSSCVNASVEIIEGLIRGNKLDKLTDISGLNFDGADTPEFNKQFIVGVATNLATAIYKNVVEDMNLISNQ